MNSLDLVLLFVMTISVAISAFRGGIRELFSLAAIVAGFMLASRYYHAASSTLLRFTEHARVNEMISFVGIFIFAAVLISFIGAHLTHIVERSRLKPLNTFLGMAVGALKGIVISALIVYAIMVFVAVKDPIIADSRAFPYLTRVSGMISPIASGFFRDEFEKKVKEFRSAVKPGKDGEVHEKAKGEESVKPANPVKGNGKKSGED